MSQEQSADTIANGINAKFSSLGRNMVVGISGRGGAGKSTLASELELRLTAAGNNVVVLHIDDFVFPKAIRDANPDPGKARYFDSYDFDTLFSKLLKPAKEAKDFQGDILVLNRQIDAQEPRHTDIKGPAVIIIEGVQLFRQQFADIFDHKIWLDISFEDGLKRVLDRKNHLGVPLTVEQKTEQYVKWSTAGYMLYEQNDNPKGQADVVIYHTAAAEKELSVGKNAPPSSIPNKP